MPSPAASPTVTFEPAAAADAPALADLRVAAMRPSLERVGRFDPARASERLLATFDPDATWHVLADGERAGFFVARVANGELLLDHLYVDPRHQGRGLGAAVLAHVFAQADAQRLDVVVGALKQSDSNRFYARHGFEPVAETDWDVHHVRRPARP